MMDAFLILVKYSVPLVVKDSGGWSSVGTFSSSLPLRL